MCEAKDFTHTFYYRRFSTSSLIRINSAFKSQAFLVLILFQTMKIYTK